MKTCSAVFVAGLLYAAGNAAAQEPAVSWRSTAKTAVFLELLGTAVS